MEQNFVRYGVYASLGAIIFTLLLYLIDPKMIFGYAGLTIWAVYLFCMYSSASNDKKEKGGFISFKEAFKSSFLVFAIASLLGFAFQLLLINVIDPSLSDIQLEVSKDAVVKVMEAFSASEDDIEKALEGVKKPTMAQNIFGYFMSLIIGAIPAVIIAAIVKKDNPRGDYQENSILDNDHIVSAS